MSVSSDYYNLDQDNTLGGDNPSISKISSQKAIKEALDTKQDVLTAGKSISIEKSNGYNWIDYTVAQQEFGFNKVIFDGEKFVALTNSGVATSTDGATWAEITLEINVYNDIAYGNGKYVMVGNMGYIATSTNGTTWSAARYNIQDEQEYKYPDWQCVAYGDNKFVALSSKMSTILAGETFAYATGDGSSSFTINFIGSDSYADNYKDIAYGNSGFVAVGAYSYIAKYNNGWGEYNIDGSYELKNVLYANGHYITPCYQGIFSSTNGTAWSFDETSVLSSDIKDSIYVNDTYLYLDEYANLHVSSDLENWQNFNYSEDIGGNEVINSLAFGNGKLIIVGDEGTIITIDYFAGTRINCVVDSQLSSTSENPVQNSVVYNALMSKQNNLTAGNSISISGSGFDFANPTANQPYQASWHDITFDGENFILVGGYTIGITSDGVTLNNYNTTGNYNSIVYANNIYVTVGYNGYIATSSDSTNWTERHISFNNGGSTEYPDWKKIVYGNGMFFAISDYVYSGNDGFVMATSSDGATWTTSFVQTEEYGSGATIFYGLATNGSDFVAVGDYMAEAVYSNSSWYMAQIELTYDTLKTIMYDGSNYIVPTSSGVYTSTDGSTWTLIENNSMGSNHIYAGYYGGKYVLLSDYSTWYVSDNLSTWQEYNFSSLMGGNEMSTAMAFGNDMILSVGDEGTIVSIPYLTGSATINCVVDSQLSSTSTNPVQNSTVTNALSSKQDTLVSGTNIKTINNESILGNGNIDIQGGGTPSNMVTTDTNQNITGEKTFVGDKRVKFKQSTSSNKLGFTLYDNNGGEKGYLEFNPSNKIDNAPLMTLGNYATAAGNIIQVGFRRYSGVSGANGAYNLLTPLIADAKSPFSLTTTYTNFYMPLGFKNGSTQVLTAKSGVADLSTLFPTIATSVSSSSTNAETVGAKLFYDTVGDIETLLSQV